MGGMLGRSLSFPVQVSMRIVDRGVCTSQLWMLA